ncbi:MAG: hypothetical protein ACXWT3_14705, partial [Methylococcaceae bacterium]
YSTYDLSDYTDEEATKFFRTGSIDAYCPNCESKSVFRVQGPPSYQLNDDSNKIKKYGAIIVTAKCTRQHENGVMGNCEHAFYAIFKREDNTLLKIGQYPAKADMDFGELDEAFKELPKNLRKELGTSIGLFSHGVGIGAFVYLRRIFETLVEDAHKEAKSDSLWDEGKFNQSRMTEKIQLLVGHLPSRLVKSANLYGILSKGLHELSEQECKDNYVLVRQAIQLILKQKHEEKEYENVINSMNKISN